MLTPLPHTIFFKTSMCTHGGHKPLYQVNVLSHLTLHHFTLLICSQPWSVKFKDVIWVVTQQLAAASTKQDTLIYPGQHPRPSPAFYII